MSSPKTTEHMAPFSLQLPSLYYAKLFELATDNQSTARIEAEAAIASLAEDHDDSPLPFVDIMDGGGIRRLLVRPSVAVTERLARIPSQEDPSKVLPLGAVFRFAVARHAIIGEPVCAEL